MLQTAHICTEGKDFQDPSGKIKLEIWAVNYSTTIQEWAIESQKHGSKKSGTIRAKKEFYKTDAADNLK